MSASFVRRRHLLRCCHSVHYCRVDLYPLVNDLVHTGLTTVAVLGTNVLCRYFFEEHLDYRSPFQESFPFPNLVSTTKPLPKGYSIFPLSPSSVYSYNSYKNKMVPPTLFVPPPLPGHCAKLADVAAGLVCTHTLMRVDRH